jgi:hypothetical protein
MGQAPNPPLLRSKDTYSLPPERTASVCFQAGLLKAFLTLFLFYIPERFLEHGVSCDGMTCASFQVIKAANVSLTGLDILSWGGLVFTGPSVTGPPGPLIPALIPTDSLVQLEVNFIPDFKEKSFLDLS